MNVPTAPGYYGFQWWPDHESGNQQWWSLTTGGEFKGFEHVVFGRENGYGDGVVHALDLGKPCPSLLTNEATKPRKFVTATTDIGRLLFGIPGRPRVVMVARINYASTISTELTRALRHEYAFELPSTTHELLELAEAAAVVDLK